MAAKVYSGRELSAFCLQISILLKAAVPLDEGLYLMAEDAPTEEEKKLFQMTMNSRQMLPLTLWWQDWNLPWWQFWQWQSG